MSLNFYCCTEVVGDGCNCILEKVGIGLLLLVSIPVGGAGIPASTAGSGTGRFGGGNSDGGNATGGDTVVAANVVGNCCCCCTDKNRSGALVSAVPKSAVADAGVGDAVEDSASLFGGTSGGTGGGTGGWCADVGGGGGIVPTTGDVIIPGIMGTTDGVCKVVPAPISVGLLLCRSGGWAVVLPPSSACFCC